MEEIAELYYRYNPWWEQSEFTENLVPRPLVLNQLKKHLSSKEVIFLSGLRRVGKTTLLKLLIKELILSQKIDPKFIFYISLDDYRLLGKDIFKLIAEYQKIHKIKSDEFIYLFLDEITSQPDFEIQLKNLYDQC